MALVRLVHRLQYAAAYVLIGIDPYCSIPITMRVLGIDPDNSIAHLNFGHVYCGSTENLGKARTHFERHIPFEPDAEDADDIRPIMEER